jgi:deoxyribonuclease (pyrimidine dimer)
MVRINLIEPWRLSDQHLVAEYNEILMLLGYVRKHALAKTKAPDNYCLGKGHVVFFRDKLGYIKKRHEALKKEMKARGFRPIKSADLKGLGPANDWKPCKNDGALIRKRLADKIRKKPGFYRYYGKKKPEKFFTGLLNRLYKPRRI